MRLIMQEVSIVTCRDDRRLRFYVRALRSKTQHMIHDDYREHRFTDWRCPDSNTGIMTALGHNFGRIPIDINRAARQTQAGCRFKCRMHDNILARRNTAENATIKVAIDARAKNTLC